MGWTRAALEVVRDVLSPPTRVVLELPAEHVFDTAPRPVDQVIAAMKFGDMINVGRAQALSVAAVQRARNEICSISTLPLVLFKGLEAVDSPLFRQFDPDVPNVVHMAATVEDLLFDGIAWWQVTGQDFAGYPASVRRIDPSKVSLVKPGKSPNSTLPGLPPLSSGNPTYSDDSRYVWIDHGDGKGWREFPAALMIRFDSPNPGVLKANARAIRIAIKLDRLTEMYAENPALREYFTDNLEADVDVLGDDEVDAFLAEYGAMRAARPFGWIPSNVKRAEAGTVSPRDLTLADLQEKVTLALANGTGVDPEDLGVSTTSRTYQNAVDRKQDKINRVYGPYMMAITDRLRMGDVTMRGYAPRFDLADYLKSDPVTQAAYWKALQDMGVVDETWIGEQAGIPAAVVTRAAAVAPPAAPALSSARPPLQLGDITPARTFDAAARLTFDVAEFSGTATPPTVDQASRTITGLAVPYNQVATKGGIKYRFKPGSLEYSSPDRMPALKNHVDPVGMHESIKDTPDGPIVALKIHDAVPGSAEKAQRDQLLYDAAGGMYTGLSVGVDFSMWPEDGDVAFNEDDQVYDVLRATWRETSSTHLPAFDNARVTKVAADLTGGNTVDPCQHCGHKHAPNIACQTFIAQLRTQPASPPAPTPPAPGTPAPAPGQTFEQFSAVYSAWLQSQTAGAQPLPLDAAGQPQPPLVVNPHAGPATVKEPAPYRFDRTGNLRAGTHDFSSDLIAGWRPGGGVDQAARDRAEGFLRDQYADPDPHNFAITPANVVNLNYPQNKPDMYVDQMEYQYPIWNAINKGTLDAVTPFVIPKFSSSSGLVADHVTGTEPTPGTFVATAQTITPSAVSGKVEITREAFDQGGNPQMSGLIYRQMTRGYFEALEAFAVAQLVLVAASMPDLTITTAAADSALDQAIASALIPLKYIRGGDRFRNVYTQIDLYSAMVKAKDTNGRRLYPSIGAQNAVGTADPRYDSLDAHGKLWLPAWATAATSVNAASSYMFDPEKVCGWASAPQRIDITWRVAWVDLGIWGYKAFGVTDFAGTRELVYDPV
jgi:hypothetical protein